jgi:ABC-2 type transport system permease protein
MFKALVNSRLTAFFASIFKSSRFKKQKNPVFKVLIVLLTLYIIGCFFFMFGWMFYSVCKPLFEYGFGWLYFALAAIMATILCFIGSVFMAQQQLFSAKDNDLLLAMPIPPAYILGSRMFALFAVNYFFEFLVLGPAGVVYCMTYTPSAAGVVLFVVCALFLAFIVMTLSCIFGWILALIIDRVRNKSLVSTVFSLCFLAAYFYFYGNMNKYIGTMVQNGASVAAAVKSAIYPAYAFGTAVANGDLAQLGLFLLCCIVPFGIVYVILSRGFISITTSHRGAAKIKYRERALKVGSASSALLRKELKHFGANGMYIMNAAMGSVFTLAAAVALVIYRDLPQTVLASVPAIAGHLGPAAAGMLCMLAATDIISAPSVSLEGKNLWIAQSLPVPGGKILMAKANMHIVVALPPIIIAALAAILVLRPSPLSVLDILLAPSLMTVFCALLGVVVNLHFPRFDFVNEVAVVKQSMSVIISMFGSMGIVILSAALYIWLLKDMLSGELFILLFSAVLAAVCAVMIRYLNNGGARRFAELV